MVLTLQGELTDTTHTVADSSGIQAYGICVQLDRTVGRMDTAMEEEQGYPSQLVSLVAPCLVVRCSKGLMVTIPDNRCHWPSTCPSL
jgi:hypothetical protein